MKIMKTSLKHLGLTLTALALCSSAYAEAADWWNESWTGRTPLSINTSAEGAEIQGEPGEAVVLVRLHPGVLPFEAVQPDGSDLRFVAADGKTALAYHLEKFDPLMAEGFAWVRVPAIAAGGTTDFWMYYGNAAPEGEGAPDVAKTYPETAKLVYHLNERGTPPQDATANAANAETAGNISEGTIIADGLRLVGRDPVKIPGSAANAWSEGSDLTMIFWVKPIAVTNEAVLFSRPGANGFKVGLAAGGAPFVEVAGIPRATATETVGAGVWRQVSLTAAGGKITLFVDGKEAGALDASLPAGDGEMFLGGPDPATGTEGRYLGEFDEFQMYGSALPAAALRLLFITQSGSELSGKVLSVGEIEGGGAAGGHGGALEHVMLFGDIANNMMFDGWIAVAVCIVMMIAGWYVAAAKYLNLGKIEKGNTEFQKLWSHVAADLTAIDLDNPEAAKSFGGKIGPKALALFKDSPLYHVYHVGSEEIRHRLGNGKNKGQGLSARSIQAIRAALDAALVHEQHRLNKNIVYLTVSIAGGPYVGLLGTVVGVMITFAIIAKSGEVDVNSIAPGIASALLATTVGLLVAIPALFMYSFLNQRIKGVIASMQVFIDEFVAKVAEFYPPPGESGSKVPIRQIRTPEQAARFEETGGKEAAELMADLAATQNS
jgi:biopolymer transport protein ExbB